MAPDAPLSPCRSVRSAACHHAQIPTRQNRRGSCGDSLGGCRQSHSGDRMSFMGQLQDELAEFRKDGVYKRLNYLDSPQDARVKMEGRGEVVILSSNNYLGLCNVPEVVRAGQEARSE